MTVTYEINDYDEPTVRLDGQVANAWGGGTHEASIEIAVANGYDDGLYVSVHAYDKTLRDEMIGKTVTITLDDVRQLKAQLGKMLARVDRHLATGDWSATPKEVEV